MNPIHCSEYGDIIEIPPSLPCVFRMISQLRGYIFPVRQKWSDHKAQACICHHMHKITHNHLE